MLAALEFRSPKTFWATVDDLRLPQKGSSYSTTSTSFVRGSSLVALFHSVLEWFLPLTIHRPLHGPWGLPASFLLAMHWPSVVVLWRSAASSYFPPTLGSYFS
ncbi:hypothetical protein BC827DRAFT_1267317 [Russula dissimulans]|nr:hypothetical protein BC827DRAFT_1267317 [Russula dissimulans]